MMTLEQCLGAHRPIIFTVAESDVEVLKHLNENHKDASFIVYSTTLAALVPLGDLLDGAFAVSEGRATSTLDILNTILNRRFDPSNSRFEKYIFLDAQNYITDPQNIRKIKDIVSRYQLDVTFTVNLIFVTSSVIVPQQLERLSEVVFFDLPNETKLKEASDIVVKRLELSKETGPSDEVLNNLKGLTQFEVEQAYLQSFHIHKKIDLEFIHDFKKNSIRKTDLLTLLETKTTFDDIGGLENLKRWIKKSAGGWTVEGKKFGLPILKGLLMVGVPGCGKSTIAKAIGSEWKIPVVQFDPSKIFSSRVGDSEANMRQVLQIAESLSPAIMFIDEIEKGLAGIQSSTFSDAGTTSRVIGKFLTWMQDNEKCVFIIATANAIQNLPAEMVGRFDTTFFVGLPQDFERAEIFKIHIKKLNRDPEKFDIKKLAECSQDLSGREIEQALKEAMYEAYYSQGKDLTTEIILGVLNKKPSLLLTMGEQLQYLLKWVGYDEVKNDGVRARFASTPNSMDMGRITKEIDDLLSEVEGKKPFE
jgi:AAA+ superfamily predicted ATPase